MFTAVWLTVKCRRSPRMAAMSGVATLKVVAVPASSANTASRSMMRPARPSVCRPRMGRQASEYFWRLHLRTWSMKPNATASTR